MPLAVGARDRPSRKSRNVCHGAGYYRDASQAPVPSQSEHEEEKAFANRKKAARKLFASNPRTVEYTIANIEIFLKDSRKVRTRKSPRHHWAMEVCCLTMFEVYIKLKKQTVHFEHVRENMENMYAMVEFLEKESPTASQFLAGLTKRCMIVLADLSTKLEFYAGLNATKWEDVAETLKPWIAMSLQEEALQDIIPRIADFIVDRILGAGGFGAVYKARYGRIEPGSGIYCTVKLVPRTMFEVSKHACVDKVVGSCTRHPCLGKYYSNFLSDQAYVTVMEYIRGVDLSRAIKRQRGLNEPQIRLILAQLGLALNHMHLKGFIHRDIKPSNLMVMPGCFVKLIDYDTIKLGIGCYTKKKLNTYHGRSYSEFNDRESAGTLQYHPPEVIRCQYYGRALDWWAVGVTAYQCFFGKLPFRGEKDDHHLKKMICECNYPLETSSLVPSPELKSFISQLILRKVSKRLCSRSFTDYLNHEFFAEINWAQVEQGQFSLACDGIDTLCYTNQEGYCSPLPPNKDFEDMYLKLEDQKETKDQIAIFTFISPGFRNVLDKYRQGLPVDESDIQDPPDPVPKSFKRRYRFENYLYRPQTRRSRKATAEKRAC